MFPLGLISLAAIVVFLFRSCCYLFSSPPSLSSSLDAEVGVAREVMGLSKFYQPPIKADLKRSGSKPESMVERAMRSTRSFDCWCKRARCWRASW
jgi:hypothetical protein